MESTDYSDRSEHLRAERVAPTASPVEGATRAPVMEKINHNSDRASFSPHGGREGVAPTASPVEGATRAPVIVIESVKVAAQKLRGVEI
jgi:hypothetical protein